jgi:hypothetical protein
MVRIFRLEEAVRQLFALLAEERAARTELEDHLRELRGSWNSS